MSSLSLETVAWSSLKDIEDVNPIGEDDYAVLSEVRSILAKHNAIDRFGVCLLHKHFEVAEDEVAIEETDVENRVSTVRVHKREDVIERGGIETTWRFIQNGTTMGTVCKAQCFSSGSASHNQRHVKSKV